MRGGKAGREGGGANKSSCGSAAVGKVVARGEGIATATKGGINSPIGRQKQQLKYHWICVGERRDKAPAGAGGPFEVQYTEDADCVHTPLKRLCAAGPILGGWTPTQLPPWR